MKFYLAGQHNFGNRGCEALVRSVTGIIRAKFPDATFLVPTLDESRDRKQWPDAGACGCEFVKAPVHAPVIKWWNRVITRFPFTKSLWEPKYKPADYVVRDLQRCDIVLMIGGDVISLDYGPGSLFLWSGLMDAAHRLGKKTMLFAASVGPFVGDRVVEKYMVRHLSRYSAITTRETASLNYLNKLGFKKSVLVADPAFTLVPESIELPDIFARSPAGVLAFNISPLVENSWSSKNTTGSLISECAKFLRRIIEETQINVILLPHVDPLDGNTVNSDSHYMTKLLEAMGGTSDRLELINSMHNASELKFIISKCRFLIAARTHATVAGWSQLVPTISIGYSVKAKGLNQDLFGGLDYMIDIPQVNSNTLWDKLALLLSRESDIKDGLANKIPIWKINAQKNGDIVANL